MRIPILREPEIFGRLVATFEGACRDDVTRHDLDEATGEWFDGLTGPAYFAGAEMFGAVYGAFGKPGVFAAMKDLCRLFDLNERAVEKVPDKLSRLPQDSARNRGPRPVAIGKRSSLGSGPGLP
jgi:hypothetical protein